MPARQTPRDVRYFEYLISQWEMDWLWVKGAWNKGGISSSETRRRVNTWLNDFEERWINGMRAVNTNGARAGLIGVIPTKEAEEFKSLLASSVRTHTAKDALWGRAERNALAGALKNNLDDMFKEFDDFVAKGLMRGDTQVELTRRFMEQPSYHDTIHLTDKGGKYRSPPQYASMYSSTKRGMITSDAAMEAMDEGGLDVVQISPISTDTPICSKYSGKYFSRTGTIPGLPVLQFTPPYHPNCVHRITAVRGDDVQKMQVANSRVNQDFSTRGWSFKEIGNIRKQEAWLLANRSNVYAGALV